MTARFEAAWSELHGVGSVATGGWSGAALAALDFAGVRGEKVLCPSNTFMATPLSIVHSGARAGLRRLQPRGPLHVVRGLRAQGRGAPAARRGAGPHRRPHRLRRRADRRLLPRPRHLPARGLRARARRALGRSAGRDLGRRRRLFLLRDQDDLDRRGRDARLGPRGAPRARARLPQLRQARPPGRGPQPADERVHRRDRAGADRAPRRDRRPQERDRSRAARPASSGRGSSCPTG